MLKVHHEPKKHV